MIGIFDSGVGGLTAVKAFDTLFPDCDIVYFGDTARIPYGTKSRDVINRYALQDCRFLLTKNVDSILVACGTVSSNSLSLLKETFDLPIEGVVEAASRKAYETAVAGNGKIAILGTSATVKSGAFEKAILSHGTDVTITSRACPLFVPLVENGRFRRGDALSTIAAKEYLEDIIPEKPASLILGCTHYPLLAPVLSELLPETKLISSSEEAARSLCAGGIKGGSGNRSFFVSDDPEGFASLGKSFLGESIENKVAQINIEEY